MHGYYFEAVPGYFAHDDPSKLPLPAVAPRFGLNDESDGRWVSFLSKIQKLNDDAAPGTSYKFFLLTRHGQGYHNVAEEKYGSPAWDEHYALLNGDDEIVWGPDPKLTPTGIEQAQLIKKGWATEAKFGLPQPHRRYCSPLTRALKTAETIFTSVYESYPNPILIKENCREIHGSHTCDKRNTRSYIVSEFPGFDIEPSFTEEDLLWTPTRETRQEVSVRAKTIIEGVFRDCKPDTFISITAHSGFIDGFLHAIGRDSFPLLTGGALPVVVKAVNV